MSAAARGTHAPFDARVVLLGASNLTRGLSTVIETARVDLGSPLEVLAALGHGRSYGMRSTVLGRSLPGIVDCGLWRRLEAHTGPPCYALLTDIGNDVVYGAAPQTIVGWVEWCIDRLRAVEARLILTRPPMDSLHTMHRWQFEIMRRVLFPSHQVTFGDALRRTEELDRGIQELARRHPATLVALPGSWYGFDPIHIPMRRWAGAWKTILASWTQDEGAPLASGSVRRWARLHTAAPQHRWLFGVPLERRQPSARLPDGTTVALY
jgi:hypothetical protein